MRHLTVAHHKFVVTSAFGITVQVKASGVGLLRTCYRLAGETKDTGFIDFTPEDKTVHEDGQIEASRFMAPGDLSEFHGETVDVITMAHRNDDLPPVDKFNVYIHRPYTTGPMPYDEVKRLLEFCLGTEFSQVEIGTIQTTTTVNLTAKELHPAID